jgi:hypothetical protein
MALTKSLKQAIEDDPDRFAKYVVDSGEEPRSIEDWVKVFEERFNTVQGNNAMQFIKDDPEAIKTIFDADNNKRFIAELRNKGIWEDREVSEERIKGAVSGMPKYERRKVSVRDETVITKARYTKYTKTNQSWSEKQIRWLKSRSKEKSNKGLAKSFNDTFDIQRSPSSIKNKKLRLRKLVKIRSKVKKQGD